jgi:exopolysaccharide biosynthesis polyprenyl glycosylphosphotransferase
MPGSATEGHPTGATRTTTLAEAQARRAGKERFEDDAALRSSPRAAAITQLPPRRDAVFRRSLAMADLAAATAALAVVGALDHHGVQWLAVLSIPLITLIGKMMGRYDHDEVVLRKSTLEEVPALLGLAAAFALTWSLLAQVLDVRLHQQTGAGALWAATAALLIVARATARSLARSSAPRERVLIVGSAKARLRLAHSLASDPAARIDVVGFLPLEDERSTTAHLEGPSRRQRGRTFDDIASVVHELDVDRVCLVPTNADNETMLDAVWRTTAVGIKVSIVPGLLEVVGSAVEFDTVGGVTILGLRRPGLSRSSRAVKRGMDLAGAALGLVVLAPLSALIAIAIKLDSPGPVFFRQPRVGREGRTFRMIKFRSMVDGAEAQRAALEGLNETSGLFKLSSDPRVTGVGKFLRSTSLDELPQLLNVLRGRMSLVGPRPLVLDEDRLVQGRHRMRLDLAPGMTGPWQVLGPTRPPLVEMVKTDYLYAATWSLWTDVKILLRTFAHCFARRGL